MSASDLWYALPLVVSVCLVYAATRYEQMEYILAHAIRTGIWMASFIVVITLVLWGMSAWFT